MTLQYTKDRQQFGRPIGSFQALKHRLVDMYLAVERATSLAYFAALTIAEDDDRRPVAAAMAKAAAGECQRRVVQDGLQLHGGVGFTWEHDLHPILSEPSRPTPSSGRHRVNATRWGAFWDWESTGRGPERRETGLRRHRGDCFAGSSWLGWRTTGRVPMRWPPIQCCRPGMPRRGPDGGPDACSTPAGWYRGGRPIGAADWRRPCNSWSTWRRWRRAEIPRTTNPQGLGIIAPSILDYGSEEQIREFAMPILRGERTGCLGMSEPGAGSDLAALSTRAVLDGDQFVINGQKVWTSGANDADFCFLFCRTDPSAPKHQGISVILVDMDTPGVRVRPLPEIVAPEGPDLNEVFLSDVVVPANHLVGTINNGWAMANGSLAHERGWCGSAA